jgi:glyoxylase-like metal-dependent hydrolase (beta-lactamase superfamily II)
MKVSGFLILAALAACSSSSPSPSSPSGTPESPTNAAAERAIHRFTIGTLEAVALRDGSITMPFKQLFGDSHVDEGGELLAAAGLSRDDVHLSIQPLLVKTTDRVLLFDTGAGGALPGTGNLTAALAEAGVAPADVTDIFISHGHGDHVGGLVTKGALTYPAATIHIGAADWAAIQGAPEDKELVTAVAAKIDAFAPGARLLPEVTAVDTAGHTPGHSSYLIGTGVDQLFYLGDVAHHYIISVQRPAWSIQFDMDHAAAEKRRADVLAKLAADRTRVYGVHFPFPGIGRVDHAGDTPTWQPE